MRLKTSIVCAIVCFSINVMLGILLRFVLLPSGALPQQSVWLKNLFSFLSLLQMLLLYVPLILFFVALYTELYTRPAQNSKVVSMITEHEHKTPEQTSSVAKRGTSVIRSMLLVIGFTILGILGIVVSWFLLLGVADAIISKESAIRLLRMMTIVAPALIWVVLFFLTRTVRLPLRHDLRLCSAIGFFLAVGIAWIGLMPWAMLGISFKGVRM